MIQFWDAQSGQLYPLARLMVFEVLFWGGFFAMQLMYKVTRLGHRLRAAGGWGRWFDEWLAYAQLALWAAILLTMTASLLERTPIADLGFRFDTTWWRDLAFGIALGAGISLAIFVLFQRLGWLSVVGRFQVAHPQFRAPFAAALAAPAVKMLCVAFWEEIVFRIYPLYCLSLALPGDPGANRFAGLLILAAPFALAHLANDGATWFGVLGIALSALVIGLGYALTGQAGLVIGLHFAWNFVTGHVLGLPVSGSLTKATSVWVTRIHGHPLWTGGRFGPETGVAAFAMMAVAGCFIVMYAALA